MKKVLISLGVIIIVVVVGFVAVLAYIGFTSDGSSEEIFGTWKVAFRFVEENGNYKSKVVEKYEDFDGNIVYVDKNNEHFGECNDEYVVFDKEKFTHFKEGKANMQTAIKYTGSTGVYEYVKDSTNLSLRSFGRQCFFVLDKYSDSESGFSVYFCSADCMAFYYEDWMLAVLIRCENIGDEIDRTNKDSIVGKWSSQFDGDKQLSDYTSGTTKNGLLVISKEERRDNTYIINNKKTDYRKPMSIYVYAERDYIIELQVDKFSFIKNLTEMEEVVCGRRMATYIRNDS